MIRSFFLGFLLRIVQLLAATNLLLSPSPNLEMLSHWRTDLISKYSILSTTLLLPPQSRLLSLRLVSSHQIPSAPSHLHLDVCSDSIVFVARHIIRTPACCHSLCFLRVELAHPFFACRFLRLRLYTGIYTARRHSFFRFFYILQTTSSRMYSIVEHKVQ